MGTPVAAMAVMPVLTKKLDDRIDGADLTGRAEDDVLDFLAADRTSDELELQLGSRWLPERPANAQQAAA